MFTTIMYIRELNKRKRKKNKFKSIHFYLNAVNVKQIEEKPREKINRKNGRIFNETWRRIAFFPICEQTLRTHHSSID